MRANIDKTNALQFKVADFVSKIFKSSEDVDVERDFVWQNYSTCIDSCAKIYGFSVDFVYSEAFKVLGGVNRTHVPEDEEEETDEKIKKRVNPGLSTLERHPENITTNKFEFATSFDPYYKQLSAAFDSAGSRGLLLGNLRVNNALELMLSSEDINPQEVQMDIESDLSLKHLLPPVEGLQLCREMQEYGQQLALNSPAAEAPLSSQLAADWEVETEDSGDEMPLDFDIEHENEEAKPSKMVTLEDRLSSIVERDDYQYFNNPRLSTWAGFEYWNKRNTVPTKPQEKRKRKEPTKIFLDPDVLEDPNKVLAKPGKGARSNWTEAYCNKVNVNELALPVDFEVSLRRLTQLFSRPQTFVKKIDDKRDVLVDFSGEQLEPQDEAEVLFASPVEAASDISPKEGLQFAKTSKRVDVKLLKETIWKGLQPPSLGKENAVYGKKPTTFMEVLKQLPTTLPQSELENLSMHSCFITLLHLANEHSKSYTDLTLEATNEVDFRIISKLG